ncbi:MAG: VOC family protein [Propionibacteriaceae bacterium]|jgi:hypothetical protein|nr:VOC family protein [Propionibacteriaceae bacterium]
MSIRIGMVTIDAADSQALALWWAEQLEFKIEAYIGADPVDPLSTEAAGGFFVVYMPDQVPLGFQQVPRPTPGKNRLHLDLGCDNRQGEVDRFVAAGATLAYEMDSWSTLADPEGNLFCVSDLT